MRYSSFLLASLVAVSATGCGFLRSLAGTNTVSLEKAEVQSVGVDLRREQKTICPREPVQMAVFVEAMMPGDKAARSLETWQGQAGASKNDRLEFSEFAFHSDQGTFDDETGWFTPGRDMAAGAGREFEIVTAYKRRPDKFTLTTKYKPDYTCVQSAGGAGQPGKSGGPGPAGKDGTWGQGEGSDGTDGSDGGDGGDGDDGGDGQRIVAHVSFVKTPFYDRLLAVSLSGEVTDLLLAPPDRPITLRAVGGAGGMGGPGGQGGQGGPGSTGPQNGKGGKGGKGGHGGKGGRGGKGGKGGDVEVIFDAQFPELERLVTVDVSGGPGGPGGNAGPGGSGGNAGGSTGQHGKPGQGGQRGAEGQRGQGGASGPAGHSVVHAGPVSDRFAGQSALTVLGQAAAPRAAEPPAPEKADPKKGKGGKR